MHRGHSNIEKYVLNLIHHDFVTFIVVALEGVIIETLLAVFEYIQRSHVRTNLTPTFFPKFYINNIPSKDSGHTSLS